MRKCNIVELLLYMAAFGISVAFPALSYILVWPLLVGLIAVMLRFTKKAKWEHGLQWTQLVGIMGPAVIAIMLFVPGILIIMISIDIRMIYLVPVFVAAFLGFLVAPLEFLLT